MNVGQRFTALLSNIALTSTQRADGTTKHRGVCDCLNRWYYQTPSGTANAMLVGSWGKQTEVRPPRDIDLLFVLPDSVYFRFDKYVGNKQSALLQEVREVLKTTYPATAMRADGQVVVVPFHSFAVEVVPAFTAAQQGQFLICDTNSGGRYKLTDPNAEIGALALSDLLTKNTRDLIRMLKTWQRVCNVPLKSFMLELLAVEFLWTWEHRGKTATWYDWMTRDFLAFLLKKTFWSTVTVPGTSETIFLGNGWLSRAQTAHQRAIKACEFEANTMPYSAGGEWQKLFGEDIPVG